VHPGTGVEQNDGPALPRLLLAPHHELAVSRRRSPVDAAQVVAETVLTRGRVVLACRGDGARHTLAGTGPLATEPDVGQPNDLRGDDQRLGRSERAGELAQPERVGQPNREWPDAEPAADLRAHGVVDIERALRQHA